MAKTRFIENLQQNYNLDTDLFGDSNIMQKENVRKIVLLDGENGNSEFIKDDINIVYFRDLLEGEREAYEDENGNKGYKQTYNFGRDDFAGTIKTVCLANKDFIDPRYSNGFSNSEGNVMIGSGVSYGFTANDMINNQTRILDFDFENGKLLTFNVRYVDGEWTAVFCRWNHNFRNFRIGGAQSYFYIDEVVSVDIGDLITVPDNQGNWEPPTDQYMDAMLYYGIDEENNNYVLTYTARLKKVFSTLTINREDMTQTELHQMILPNEVSWPSNMNWNYCNARFGCTPRNSLFYKGRLCMPLYTTRIEHEQEISDVYMCSINYKNSTDIRALETHSINSNGVEVDWNSNMPYQPYQPLIGSGCKTAISSAWTIKNDVAYIKQGGAKDWGFYYKGMMLSTAIGGGSITLQWQTCPYCLSIYETLTKPFLKTLNKTLKYTFRIVNTGGYFYYDDSQI